MVGKKDQDLNSPDSIKGTQCGQKSPTLQDPPIMMATVIPEESSGWIYFECPSRMTVGQSVYLMSSDKIAATEVEVFDCPNFFVHIFNGCYRLLDPDTYESQVTACRKMDSFLLLTDGSDRFSQAGKKLLVSQGVQSAFVGELLLRARVVRLDNFFLS